MTEFEKKGNDSTDALVAKDRQEQDEITTMALDHFIDYFKQLIDALNEIFPEDKNMQTRMIQFKVGIENMIDERIKKENKIKLMETFHKNLQPYYEKISIKDSSFMEHSELLKDVHPLFNALDTESKDTLWEYLDLLVQHATCYNMYAKIPPNLKNRIGNMTKNIEQMTNDKGEINIKNVSQQILQDVNPDEMRDFALGMMADKEGLQDIFRIATSQMSKLQEATGSKGSEQQFNQENIQEMIKKITENNS